MPVKCRVCGWTGRQLKSNHLQKHGMTKLQYLAKFPGSEFTSKETKDKIRARAKSRPPATPETNEKIRQTMKSVYANTDFPLKKNNANQFGKCNNFFGRSHSNETKEKLSASATRWLKEAYATGKKTSPFAILGNGKQLSCMENEVFKRVKKFGFKINYPIPFNKGCYKIDLAIPSIKLAVELDSKLHQLKKEQLRDKRKDAWLKSLGWAVKRIKTSKRLNPCVISTIVIITLKNHKKGLENENKIYKGKQKAERTAL